jgi:hypothetical protein
MDIPEVRRQVRAAIERARREAAGRRTRSDAASRAYEEFLASRAVPMFHQVAAAMVAEGHRFKVFTPAGSVRLSAEGSPDDFIELILDPTVDPPTVLGRASIGRGRRAVTRERPVKDGTAIGDLTESDVLEFLVSEMAPFVER